MAPNEAAAEAAAPAAAPATAKEPDEAVAIRFPFDPKTTQCVPDLRSLCRLPADPDDDGVQTFRAMLFPIGKTIHVPNEPGAYATLGPWRMQMALCLVHFHEATKRNAELLLSFVDYGMVSNSSANGIFVMSLQLPLQKARNVFEETPRFTSIQDVIGFSQFNPRKQPWCAVLKPALERQAVCADLEVFNQLDIVSWLKKGLQSRLGALEEFARTDIGKLVRDLERQDKKAAQKAKAKLESRLAAVCRFFLELPPSKYDRSSKERIIQVTSDSSPQWLNTPVREGLVAGKAKLACTVRRELHLDGPSEPADTPIPPALPAAKPKPIDEAEAADKAADADSDEFAELSDPEVLEVQPVGAGKQPVGGKRARAQPARYVTEQEGKKPAKKKVWQHALIAFRT